MLLIVLFDFIFDYAQDGRRIRNDFVIKLLTYTEIQDDIQFLKKCKLIFRVS
jgi:hypothetical protein